MAATRKNLELDDELLERAMRLYGMRTRKETIDLALRRLVGSALTREQALDLESSGWEGSLGQMRRDALPDSA